MKTLCMPSSRTVSSAALLLFTGLLLAGANLSAAAPTFTAPATLQNNTNTTVKMVVTGTDFGRWLSSGTATANSTDRGRIKFEGKKPTAAVIDSDTQITLTFSITGSSGVGTDVNGNLEFATGAVLSADPVPEGNLGAPDTIAVTDAAAPLVLSSNRVSTSPTNDEAVDFTVTFSEPVDNVTVADFGLIKGVNVTGTVATVSAGPASVFTVGVTGVGGNGSLELAAVTGGTLRDVSAAANALWAGYTAGQAYTIDTAAPSVSSVVVSQPMIADATAGSATFAITVKFNDTMTRPAAPTLSFTPDVSSTLTLNPASAWSSGSQYVARYDVVDAGVNVANVVIGVSGATDDGGNLQSVYSSGTGKFSIDTENPRVTSVTSALADGTYLIGANVDLGIVFSETVNVNSTGGTPQLFLETGATDRAALYQTGNGTAVLTFRYVVETGDVAADLDCTGADALGLNGGTMVDAAGNAAVRDLPDPGDTGSLSANKNLVIDTTVDLALAKTVDQPRPNEGETVVYTLTATNLGPNTATGISVADVLPAGVTLLSADPGYAAGVWAVGALAKDASATLHISATVNAGTAGDADIANTAALSAVVEQDTAAANDQATAAMHVPLVDVALNLTVDNARPVEGETVVYTLTATNHGPDSATDLVVRDVLPAGLTLVTADLPGYVNGNWAIGTLAKDASITLHITATVDAGTAGSDLTSTATVSALREKDADVLNDQATATFHIPLVDVAVTMAVDNARPIEGEAVVYTVTATNHGPDAATALAIADALPAGVTLTASAPSQGTYAAGVWTVGTLVRDASASLQLTVTVANGTAGGPDIVNTAAVSALHGRDAVAANDQAFATIHVPLVDIVLDMAVTVPPANAPNANEGDTVVFTVTATNAGPDYASNVRIRDVVPATFTVTGCAATLGAYVPPGVWEIPNLAKDTPVTLTLTTTVNSGTGGTTLTNSAALTAVREKDAEADNNSAGQSVYIELADLEIGPLTGKPATSPRAWTIPLVKAGEYRLTLDNDVPKFLLTGCTEVQGPAPLSDDRWHYIVCRVSRQDPAAALTPRTVTLFIDGQPVATKTAGGTLAPTTAPLLLGTGPAGVAPYGGAMDEVRVSQKAHSDAWVKAAFSQQTDPAAFLAVGGEDAGTVYTFQKTLTVSHLTIDEALVDFPVLVNITDADLRTAANGGHVQTVQGYDIRFTLPDGTVLSHEIERFAGNTGSLVAWVKVPALSASADTPFVMHYGDATVATPTADAAAVWSDGFTVVQHFATETVNVLPDSSAAGNAATNLNASLLPLGQTGPACTFNGTTSVLTLADHPTLSSAASDFTIEGWFIRRDTAADAWFKVQLTNQGPDAADHVLVENFLTGMGYVNHYTEKGTFDGSAMQWQAGTLAKDEVVTLWVSTDLSVAGPVRSTMEVMAADQADHDSLHGNHAANEDDQISTALNEPPPVNEKPDFVVSGIVFAAAPVPGAFFTAQVTVTNQGRAPGNAGVLKVWADHSAAALPGESADVSLSVGGLGVGESRLLSVLLQAPLASATHTVRAFADGNDATAEQSEGNNQLTKSYTFAAPVVENPDFVVSAIAFFPGPPVAPGASAVAKVTIKNNGLAAGDPGVLKAWADRPDPATAADAADVTVASIGVLAPGESTVRNVSFTAAATMGTHVFRAFVDGTDATVEQSEGNNQSSRVYEFADAVAGKPDFIVSGILFTPASPVLGGSFDATVTVKNQGPGSGNPGRLRIWLNHPLTAGNEAGDREPVLLGNLAMGESVSITFIGLTAPAVPGTYAFRAFVDAESATTESSEGNNQKTRYYTLSAPVAENADFVITNISFSPTPLLQGGGFTAFVTVKNQGLATAVPGTLRVWLDHYANALPEEFGDAQQPVASLAPGATVIMTFNGLTAPAVRGTHTFRAFVDADAATVEQSEGNNQKTVTYGWY